MIISLYDPYRHLASKLYIHSVAGNKSCVKSEQIKEKKEKKKHLMSVHTSAKVVDRNIATAKCRK